MTVYGADQNTCCAGTCRALLSEFSHQSASWWTRGSSKSRRCSTVAWAAEAARIYAKWRRRKSSTTAPKPRSSSAIDADVLLPGCPVRAKIKSSLRMHAHGRVGRRSGKSPIMLRIADSTGFRLAQIQISVRASAHSCCDGCSMLVRKELDAGVVHSMRNAPI